MVGSIEQRVLQIMARMPNLDPLNVARMVRLDEFEQGFIAVDELFSDPPEEYLKEAIKARFPKI